MGRARLIGDLYVFMNGQRVGTLTRYSSGILKFSYHPDWLAREDARPISLSMPLSESNYEGAVVYHFFDNLLPDSLSIRERIQSRFGAQSNTCFDLLSYIGADCVGALQLLTEPIPQNIQKIETHPLDDKSIANLLKAYQTAPLGMQRDSDFRISIAGAQEKTALLQYQEKWYLPKGATPTTHIIKLPLGFIQHAGIHLDLSQSVENEWLCLKIFKAYGLPVNEAEMVLFDDIKTLVVKRFDRRFSTNGNWIVRLPQEDMCQSMGVSPGLKYESDGGPGILKIMKILQGSFDAKGDCEKFMKSVFLFWVMGAIDGHAKNFSIAIEAAAQYRLTPLYDVISAYPIVNKNQLQLPKLKMAMSLKGKNRHYLWNEIQARHWISMANLCRFPEATMKIIMEEICDSMESVINSVEKTLPDNFPITIATSIFKGMREVRNRCQQNQN
jgi:serine/threonine-protein kinase HipA